MSDTRCDLPASTSVRLEWFIATAATLRTDGIHKKFTQCDKHLTSRWLRMSPGKACNDQCFRFICKAFAKCHPPNSCSIRNWQFDYFGSIRVLIQAVDFGDNARDWVNFARNCNSKNSFARTLHQKMCVVVSSRMLKVWKSRLERNRMSRLFEWNSI